MNPVNQGTVSVSLVCYINILFSDTQAVQAFDGLLLSLIPQLGVIRSFQYQTVMLFAPGSLLVVAVGSYYNVHLSALRHDELHQASGNQALDIRVRGDDQ